MDYINSEVLTSNDFTIKFANVEDCRLMMDDKKNLIMKFRLKVDKYSSDVYLPELSEKLDNDDYKYWVDGLPFIHKLFDIFGVTDFFRINNTVIRVAMKGNRIMFFGNADKDDWTAIPKYMEYAKTNGVMF